ncbi:hypothetical protein RJZ56_004915 [Blastomyces dermatitidis]|uniref:Histone chaperone domain-containing protein n=3 Tax=Blastomyces TaxID=229219 RepID=A0A179USM3_BLAGS|nr:hypothetical protein, variant [Blastomyces gilchristii SLH14081]XP_045277290.1 hypothetical protein, variant [Blastomyces dermatitidis ER-3]EQL35537.1 hypothetical protein, variant [Blastomyces dermatitidis ATCC 26199]KMW67526.1 hypothetical protein, variant [Blastomyces dermatitidis ATCC 18188]EEQ90585.1 hypothetical protein, variant [Blastomyces dermatitidis ER-3]OAT11096.1 hypothetical protein, variant [Blastomyces gilchristii SLH14081]
MGDTGAAAFGGGATSGLDKGKGKAVDTHPADDVSMGEDEESSSEESTVEDLPVEDDEDEDTAQDNLEPISADNIISDGRRTRGKMIDFAEAAKKAQEAGDPIDDEDDDDGDFELQDDTTTNQDDDHIMRD